MKRERGTGSLKLRGGVFWLRYRHAGKRVEESSGVRDDGTEQAHNKALARLRQKTKVADTPAFVPPAAARVTFESLCGLLKADYARKGRRSARRLDGERGPLGHLAETFAGWPALRITAADVDHYADERVSAGAQAATVNRELAALRRMFKLAVKKVLLPTAPAIELRPEDNARQGFVDPGDFEALLVELRQRDAAVADAVEAAYFTCLRRGNVLGLTWPMLAPEVQDGTLVGGELRLPGRITKNKKPLTLPLTGRLLDVLARRWAARLDTCPHVFHRKGRRVVRFATMWREAAAAIGRPGLLFHDLRRSGARALRRAGVDELTIMALGGWRTRSMFARYSITDSADLVEAQAKLNAAFTTATRTVLPLRRAIGDSLGTVRSSEDVEAHHV